MQKKTSRVSALAGSVGKAQGCVMEGKAKLINAEVVKSLEHKPNYVQEQRGGLNRMFGLSRPGERW